MRKIYILLVIVVFFAISFFELHAQPSQGGTPPSIEFGIKTDLVVKEFIPIQSLKTLQAQDLQNSKQGLPMRAGVSVPVSNLGLDKGGTWTRLPDGRMMWQARLKSSGASSLGVVFEDFYIPEQAELYLYDVNKRMIIGAFTEENNHPSLQFSTHVLPGDEIIIEYVEPFNMSVQQVKPQNPDSKVSVYSINSQPENYRSKGSFRISELMYIYNDRIHSQAKDLGDSGSCEVNINCSPEGDGYQVQKRGVARILFKEGASWYYCSGTLINNTANNGQPYFLTAYHCGGSASAADKNVWQFYFNYERPGCPNTGTPPNNMITGCSMRASGDITGGSDMLLLMLNTTPSLSWNPYYNGWDRNATGSAGGVGIHHPSGDAKKISTYTATPGTGTWSGGATNAHWTLSWVATTNGAGVTEGGSSGSPLFRGSNKYVIGTLTGGASQCGGPMGTDYYGKMSYHWESNGTTDDKKLRPWLDPLGTNPTTCPGFDPNAVSAPPVADFNATPTTVTAGTPVQFTDLSSNVPTEWEWSFPGGFPSTSTLRNPSVTYTTPGTYTVTLTARNSYGENTKVRTNYITVNAYSAPSSPITIGTETNSGGVVPLGKSNTQYWIASASIYLASEIGNSCQINQIAWRPSSARTDTRNIQIYLKHTTQTALSQSTVNDLIADATLVYDGTFVPNVAGWLPITLQFPFHYIAGNNLMVITVVNAAAGNAQSNCYYTTSTNRHQQWLGNSNAILSNNGTVNSNRPNIQLFVSGYTAPVANFAGLNPIFSEDFESSTFPPTGWTINNVDGGGSTWTSSTSFNHTSGGSRAASHQYSAAGMQDGWFISPQITNLPSNASLSFWSYNQYPTYYGGTYQGKNSVLISTTNTNPASFTEIWSPASVTASWVQTTLDLSAYAGQNIYIAFRYQGNDAHDWFLDDVLLGSTNYTQINTYEGDPLTIFDMSTNNPTMWEWTCPGSTTPSGVTTQNANLLYNVAGQYNVSLRAGNPAGQNTKTVNNFVNVIGRPPISNFVGVGNLKNIYGKPFIPRGGTVDFIDRSQRVPTSWNWTFENASPASSTQQNPSGVVYNVLGTHDVTLYTANAHGNHTVLGQDYVIVGGKDTCTNFLATDNLTIYNYTNGLIPGHAADASGKIFRYAELFNNNYPGTLYGFGMYVYRAQGTGKNITLKVWADNGGVPGTELYSETRAITSFTEGTYNEVIFATPVSITGKFYVGWLLNYDATHNYTTHQFCGVMAVFREQDTASTGYFSYGSATPGTWYSFQNGFGNASSLWIDAIFEYQNVGPNVTATATPDCLTGSVTISSDVTANQTFVLTDNGGATLQTWTGNANSHTFTGLSDGIYRGKTINGGNESALSNAVTLTNYPASVGGTLSCSNSQICEGSNTGVITLSGHTGSIVKWQKRVDGGSWTDIANTTTTYSEIPSSAGTWDYRAEVQSGTCTSAFSSTWTITVDPSSNGGTLSGPNTSICIGASTGTMTVTGYTGNIQKWQKRLNAGAWQDITNTNATYSEVPSSVGTWDYRVEVKSGQCAVAYSNNFTVTVNALPTPSISPASASICVGGSTTLTASGGTGYNWSTGATTAAITVNPATTTTYTVTVSNAAGCTASTSATVTVNALPTPSITPASASICVGESTTLTASGGTGYSWNTGATTAAITVNPATTTTYTVTVSNAAGCTASTSATVTVNALPTPSISPSSASICVGGSTTLTASGGTGYSWSTGATTAAVTVNPATTTTYTVTVTNAAGCTASTSATVTVNALPTPSISPASASICVGGSTTLTASGGTGYSWNTGATTAAITVNPATTTTYTVTVSNAAGCTAITSATVTVNALPTPSISPASATICAGESTTLTASGGTGYSWSTGATTAAITVNPATTTTYTVTVSNAAGCTASTSATVTVNALPTPSITPSSASICVGGSTTLTANGGTGYSWNTGATTAAITVNPATTTTYTVTVNNASGCTASTSATVTVNALPTPSISPASATICAGESTTLTASGGTGYNWSTGATTAAITVNPATTTTYTVTVTNAAGCTASTGATVTVNALPTPSITPASASICAGESTTLTASGGTGYNWSTGATTAAITVNPATTTTYTVTVSNAAGCTASTGATVTVNALPTPSISPASASICAGESTTLTASGGTGYNWSTGATTAAITVNPATTTTYTVTVTNAAGCTASTGATVTVNALPTPSISPASASICVGESTTLTASGGTGYNWSTGATTAAITVNPATTTTYTVTVTNAAGCTASTGATVTVNALPTPSITPASASICAGESTTLTASGGTGYNWSTGATTAAITVNPATTTTYTVTVTNAAGCTASTGATVTVNALPTPSITPSSASICVGESTTLTASGGTGYNWSTGATTAAITVNPATTTTYTVTVTNAAGCTASTGATVTVNALPTASITPSTTTICPGSNVTLTASGGTGYNWSTGATTAAITVNPATTTTYTVTVTNAAGCTASTDAIVNMHDVPVANAGVDQTIPNGTSTTLNGSASGGSGSYSYSWSPAGSLIDPNLQNPTTAILTSSTTFTLYVTDLITGCIGSDQMTVNVSGGPLSANATATPNEICFGASTQLSANASGGSGTYTYNWSSSPAGFSSTDAAPVVNPNVTTTYFVTVNDGFTSETSQVTVTVNALPSPSITPASASICVGESTTLTASGGTGYNWSTGATTAAITVNPATTTTYTVTVSNATGCTASTSATVTVNALPTPSISPASATICVGESTTITASGGTGYSWSTGATTAAITVNPATTTTYTVTVTNAASCTASTSATVTVNTLPTPSISPASATICAGESATLTASGGTGYNWSTGATTAAITVNPATTTTYTVTVSNAVGCTASTSVTVTVNALPTPSISPASASICVGESTTLTASGGTGYSWSTGATTAAITVNPATTTTYTVTVSNAAGCTASTSATVTVNALPTPSISPASASICVGGSTTLTASGGTGYSWSTGATTAAVTVNPATTTTYTVTVSNAAGCTASTSATVTVNALPTPSISPSSASICVGGSTTLTASGGTGYNWSTGATTAAITVNPTTTTSYTVTVSNAAGCTASTSAAVTVNPLPIVNAGPDVSIPFGTSTTLTGSAAGGSGFYNYSWDPAALVLNPTFSTTNTVNLNTTTIFTLTATDQVTGCIGSDQVTVIVTGGPLSVNASTTNTEICFGSSTQLNALATGGSGTYLFTWSSTPAGFNSNLQNPTVNPTATTTYSVTVSDGFNTASSSVTITVNPLPVANAGDDQVICEGSSATLVATGGDNYLWSTLENTASIVVSPAITTTYTVTVYTVNGCTATDNVTVTVNPTPVVNAGVDVTVCENVLVTLSAIGAPTLTWDNGVENNVPFLPPLGTTVYTVVGTNAFGCSASDQVTVTVNQNPVANAGDDVQICFGESINLTATGGSNYSWSTGGNTPTITVSPINTLTYTVTVYNAFGCQATDDVTVTVNPLPFADAGANETICEGGVVTLSATGGVDYLWSTNDNTQSIEVAPLATTTYQVTVTNEYNCSAFDVVTVFVNEVPDVQLVVTNAQCGSSDGAIEAVVTGGSGTYIYTWDENTGYQTGPIASNLGAGTYSITVNDGNCPVIESAEVIEAAQPVVLIDASSTVICEGESVTLTATGADSYEWTPDTYLDTNFGETVVSTPAQSITYTVVGYSGNCSSTASVDITVNSYPVAYFVYNDLGMGEFEFSDLSLNAESYFWDFGDGTNANVQNPVHVYTEEGEYTVSLTVTNSCGTSTYDVVINVVITNIVITNSNVALMVYPNPNNGLFNINLEGEYAGKIYLEVFDLAGRKIMIDEWNKETSEFNIPMDFTTLARGVYNLRVIVGDDVINTNVIFR